MTANEMVLQGISENTTQVERRVNKYAQDALWNQSLSIANKEEESYQNPLLLQMQEIIETHGEIHQYQYNDHDYEFVRTHPDNQFLWVISESGTDLINLSSIRLDSKGTPSFRNYAEAILNESGDHVKEIYHYHGKGLKKLSQGDVSKVLDAYELSFSENQLKKPMSICLMYDVNLSIHEVYWQKNEAVGEGIDSSDITDPDVVGCIFVSEGESNIVERFDIWFDEEGNHYVCLPSYGNSEFELDDYLIEDLLMD
ncbi:hypothetical protein H0266_18355 [Halobacillus locisalis]|uniref:Uncharacterized protein n=1 Tax=Halobacillus locisalis TaxID=220753 RepID=A0A838CYQ7_9BACI|nr:hypothetical protein [Halobacillus locisalis]MBA2176845.1 hypothetical protein [Halobacillus locisalis]